MDMSLSFDDEKKLYAYDDLIPEDIALPQWEVYFEGNFFGHSPHKGQRQGKEICVEQTFFWLEKNWRLPSVYLCGKGLVMDLICEISLSEFQSYLDKWKDVLEGEICDERLISRAEAENPLNVEIEGEILTYSAREIKGGKEKKTDEAVMLSTGLGTSFHPAYAVNCLDSLPALIHYHLPLDRAYAIRRLCFPWKDGKKPSVQGISITLRTCERACFVDDLSLDLKDTVFPLVKDYINPVTGEPLKLTILGVTKEKIDMSSFMDELTYPDHMLLVSYRISPESMYKKLEMRDQILADSPRKKPAFYEGEEIIGGADGPTAIFFAGRTKMEDVHSFSSSLHFEEITKADFSVFVREKMDPDLSLTVTIK